MRNTRHVSNLTPKRRKFKESSPEEKQFIKKKQYKYASKNTFLHPDYHWIRERIRGTGTGINQAYWYGYRKNQKTGVCKRNGFGLFLKI